MSASLVCSLPAAKLMFGVCLRSCNDVYERWTFVSSYGAKIGLHADWKGKLRKYRVDSFDFQHDPVHRFTLSVVANDVFSSLCSAYAVP
jgi:hypothetical protein